MRRLAGLLAAALVAVLVPSTSVASIDACDTVTVRSYKIRVDVKDDTYRIGEKAKVVLTVTRKKTGDAISGAPAAVMIRNEHRRAVFGVGETNEQGRTLIKPVLSKRDIRPGQVRLFAYAYDRRVDAYCATFSEYGYKKVPRAFRIER